MDYEGLENKARGRIVASKREKNQLTVLGLGQRMTSSYSRGIIQKEIPR